MTGSAEDVFQALDRAEAPDLWGQIVERGRVDASEGDDLVLVDFEPDDEQNRGDMKRTGRIGTVGVVAASIMVIVVLVVVATSRDDAPDDNTAATDPAVTAETLPRPFGTVEASQVSDAYFDAFNSRDASALLSLFVLDAAFPRPAERADFEELVTWKIAQGATWARHSCEAIQEPDQLDTVRMSCTYEDADALVQAVDSQPVPIFLDLVVTADGIAEFDQTFGFPDFNRVGEPFGRWMLANHPGDASVGNCCTWRSIEQAEQNGRLLAQYAVEWAASLEASGCEDDRFGICR